MSDSERDKGKLIKFLKAQRVLLETILEQLSEAEMLLPGVEGELSVKDIIAHITIWDQRGTRWIEEAAQGRIPTMPEPGTTWADLDALNAETFQSQRERPLNDVFRDFEAAFPPLLAMAEAFPESELERPLTFFNGREDQTMPAGRLIAWRYRHYRTHGQAIRAWHERKVQEAKGIK